MKNILYDWHNWNNQIFEFVHSYATIPWIQYLWLFCDVLFSMQFFVICYISAFIVRARQMHQEHFTKYAKLGVNFALMVVVFSSIKYTFKLPRPYCMIDNPVDLSIMGSSCFSSFPSAHAGVAVILTTMIKNKILALLMCVAVGVSRIGLGMHYPADVAYGFLISYLILLGSDKIYKTAWMELLIAKIFILCQRILKKV